MAGHRPGHDYFREARKPNGRRCAGLRPERVIWFYKLDLDPAVATTLPRGWRDIDYLVSSPALRAEPDGLPTVATLLRQSTVVVTFGTGADRIEIRHVNQEAS